MTQFLPEPTILTSVASVRTLERLMDVLRAVGWAQPLVVLRDADRRFWNLENTLPDVAVSENLLLDAAWQRFPFPSLHD